MMFRIVGVVSLVFSCCELLVQSQAVQHVGDAECRPAIDAIVGKAQFLAHRKSTHRQILVATPLKNSAHALPHFAQALQKLTYPKAYLSVAFLVSDSIDNTAAVARELRQGALHDFASVQVFEQDFHYEAPADRHAYAVQATRRAILAKSRNLLIQKALTEDIFAVLWLDVDITGFPTTLVHDLLGMGRPVVAPHVLIGQVTYDRNTWRENKPEEAFQAAGPEVVFEGYPETALAGGQRSYMDDLRASALAKGASRNQHYAVCIDGVGTAVLFVEARVHREGVVFPEVPYKKRLESEGFGLWAKDRGFQPCGLPFYEVYHFDEWATPATVGTHRRLALNSVNKTSGSSKEERICEPWCRGDDSPWATKCQWKGCNGCSLCSKEVGCAAQCGQFRNGARGTEAFLCVGPSENGKSPCYPPSNGRCDGNMPRCETETSAKVVPAGALDGVCAGPAACTGKEWATCRRMQTQEGKCSWKTLPSKKANTTNTTSVKAPQVWECVGKAECAGKEMNVCMQLKKEGKCKWEIIKPDEATSGECIGKAECDDKAKRICQQLRQEGKCAWVPALAERKTPTGDCLGQAECIGKTRRICHRMRQEEGKCSWKPAPDNEVKVFVTIKNVSFTQMDAESKQELRAALQTTIADKAGVDETAVNITLTAGSVKVFAVIDLEERIGIMEGESEGQDMDLMNEMESLKDEVQDELKTGDAMNEILMVASSVEGVQLAAEGDITVGDLETSVTLIRTVQATSTETNTPSFDSDKAKSATATTTPTASVQESGGQPVSSRAAVRDNAVVSLLVACVAVVVCL